MDDTASAPHSAAQGPDPGGWAALACVMAPHLAQAAGEGAQPVSVALEVARPEADRAELSCRAWVERATRTLVFLGAEARTADGALAASATAVFRRT